MIQCQIDNHWYNNIVIVSSTKHKVTLSLSLDERFNMSTCTKNIVNSINDNVYNTIGSNFVTLAELLTHRINTH